MSTKASIAHGDEFHFYEEVFDDKNVFLEVSGQSMVASMITDCGNTCITTSIPRSVMDQIASEYLKSTIMELVAGNPELHLTSSNEIIREAAEHYIRNRK